MTDQRSITAILVPQGAEYQAVRRGLRHARADVPVVPIPMGVTPVQQYFQTQGLAFKATRPRILVMGLCGSLTPDLQIGDAVVYESCAFTQSSQPFFPQPSFPQPLECDRPLTHQLLTRLEHYAVQTVRAITSDCFIHSAQEKRRLGQTWNTAVVDMEGTAILEALNSAEFAVAMLRVVSDGCEADMPDLSNISSPTGSLLPGRLAIALVRQPFAGIRLVRGSLTGLRLLENLTCELFC